MRLTYGSIHGENHGQHTHGENHTLILSGDEYITKVHWGECTGANIRSLKGCICHLKMETNHGNSIGPLGSGAIGKVHKFNGHRLLYINSTTGVIAGSHFLTQITMVFGFCSRI